MTARTLSLIFLLAIFAAACGDDAKENTSPDSGTDSSAPDACEGLADGTPCGVGQICLGEVCGASECGDGHLDANAGEKCDDGNFTDGDGCDANCTFSCNEDADCSDGNICNGIETCVALGNGGKRCQSGVAPNCPPDPNPCIDVYCDPDAETLETACQIDSEVVCYRDNDEDRFPDPNETTATINECDCPDGYMRRENKPFDCNDNNPDVHPALNDNPAAFSDLPYCEDGTLATAGPTDCRGKDLPREAVCHTFACDDGSTPSFDFDCNGKETMEMPKPGPLAPTCREGCTAVKGWLDDWIPPCGSLGTQTSCTLEQKICTAARTGQMQTCR